MREIEVRKGLKKTSIVLYDDIDQMPIERFNKANKYWMLHDNLGSTFQDIDLQHINRLMLVADNKEKLVKELENLRILVYNIINEINPNHMAFACLVYSIDGKVCDDLSEEGIKKTIKLLNDRGITEGDIKKKLSGKKSMKIWNYFSPVYFKTFFQLLTGRNSKRSPLRLQTRLLREKIMMMR